MFWFDGKRVVLSQVYDDDSVVSVGACASVETASVGAAVSAAGSVAGAAVTVTEARGAVEVGRMGATPWGKSGGSWEGSIVGRGGNGARPGRLRGGRDARDGTPRGRERGQE